MLSALFGVMLFLYDRKYLAPLSQKRTGLPGRKIVCSVPLCDGNRPGMGTFMQLCVCPAG